MEETGRQRPKIILRIFKCNSKFFIYFYNNARIGGGIEVLTWKPLLRQSRQRLCEQGSVTGLFRMSWQMKQLNISST
jgi:hypothetical protein